jgi:hypothetical protein
MREKLDKYTRELEQKQVLLDQTKNYDRKLRDMRAALGFVFGVAGMKPTQVPSSLSEKLTRDLTSTTLGNQDLEQAL